jgi:hypothetical protein
MNPSHNLEHRRFSVESLERRVLLAGTITGSVFDDKNGNSVRDSGEPGLANQVVFIDLNFDGQQERNEPAAISDSKGLYSFANRPNGIQRVRYNAPTGRRQTIPTTLFRDISVAGGVTNNVNFGSTSTSVVAGVVFNDLNGNGTRDVVEPGLGGWTVFLDKNNNGKLDTGERSRVTTSNGAFRFPGLVASTYNLRIVQQTGFTRSAPLSGVWRFVVSSVAKSISNRNFGEVANSTPGGDRP